MTQKALLQSAGDGTAVPAGYVGEVKSIIQSVAINIATGSNFTNIGSVLVPKGVWKLSAQMTVATGGAMTFNEALTIGYSTDSSTSFSDQDLSQTRSNNCFGSNIINTSITNTRNAVVADFGVLVVASDTTYYFKQANRASAGSYDILGARMFFIRIA